MSDPLDQTRFSALGTTAVVLVSQSSALGAARMACERVIAEIDRTCSRFRDDSELTRANARAGEWVPASPTFLDALEIALAAARATGGLVDPTVGMAMREIGYDRDFSDVVKCGPPVRVRLRRVPGWQCVEVDRARGRVRIPKGVSLDLGATAKAWCADRAAGAAVAATGVGVAIGLGGDLSFAGTAPDGGWPVRLAEDHREAFDDSGGQTVSMFAGGVATSGTSARRWTRGDRAFHHIIDPAQGRPASDCWRVVSVAGPSCTEANVASTAAVVLGVDAPSWLQSRQLPARLVDTTGRVTYIAGWPAS